MSPFGRSDSPPPSWYEPLDVVDEGDIEHEPREDFVVISGLVCWSAAPVLDDD